MRSGLRFFPGFLDRAAQQQLAGQLSAAVPESPFFTPVMPRTGRPFTVRMTNLGSLGWVSDRAGYRYQPTHPETGRPWPPMPDVVLDIWRKVADCLQPFSQFIREALCAALLQHILQLDLFADIVDLCEGQVSVKPEQSLQL